VGSALNLGLTALVARADQSVGQAEASRLARMAQRRLAGEPVARITGEKEFWGLRLKLSEDTLVPRPDTETVVEAALDFIKATARAAPRIADIGTGSGAILLALLSELPEATGVGTDISEAALAAAKANAESLGISDRARFAVGDYASALQGRFDVIVSNPPYIRSADIPLLAIEVRDHEPRQALDGGTDGLLAYRRLAAETPAYLAPGGALIVEVGYNQAEDVGLLMEAAGFRISRPFRRDLSGIPRVVEGTVGGGK